MVSCKRCGAEQIVKNGTVRGKQRYICKRCGCHFVEMAQREKEEHMVSCKRCGTERIVKSGTVRGKQRYLCKRCGCHFVEGDQREKEDAVLPKALCTIFRALGATQHRKIREYLRRDISLVHRWMNEKPLEYKRHWDGSVRECEDIYRLFEEIKEGGVANGNPILIADNVIDDVDDFYVAVILQRRKKR